MLCWLTGWLAKDGHERWENLSFVTGPPACPPICVLLLLFVGIFVAAVDISDGRRRCSCTRPT